MRSALERFVERRPAPRGLRFPAAASRSTAAAAAAVSLRQFGRPVGRARCCRPAAARAPRPCAPAPAPDLRAARPIARICASSRAADAFSERERSSRPARSARSARVLLADRVRVRLQTLELAARFFQSLLLIEAGLFLLAHQRLALLRAAPASAGLRAPAAPAPAAPPKAAIPPARIPRPACAARDRAPARLFPAPAAGARRCSRSSARRAVPRSSSSSSAVSSSASRCASFHLAAQFAQLALQRQRTAAGLAAAADRVAVIADAVLQQEIAIRIRGGQRLRRAAVGDQEAARQPRQQALRSLREPVGQPQRVAQPADDARRARTDPAQAAKPRSPPDAPGTSRGRRNPRASAPRRARLRPSRPPPRIRALRAGTSSQAFSQAGSATSTKSASTPAGLKPSIWPCSSPSEQALHRFGGVGAMRKNLFERILAGLLPRQRRASSPPASAAPRPCAPAAP